MIRLHTFEDCLPGTPSVADATAFGMLINIVGPDDPSPLKDAATAMPKLIAYIERMQTLFDGAASGTAKAA
ncbi:MAG: glutathione S-transferase C-terminal domain-containing protein [Parvibaculum sp.]